ncbi:hypothetical protein ACOBQX_05320 [Actinokineospora sp. G85]|uniref:hypothetical protein n=1 Tax=Actinokineospora sp. G85 TaxID=3406626 RepID=UPI003C7569A2
MEFVDSDHVGMASGLLNTARGGANALVLAVFGAGLASVVQAGVDDRALAGQVAAGDLSGGDRAFLVGHYTTAWQVVLWAVAGACVVAFVVILRLTRPRAAL